MFSDIIQRDRAEGFGWWLALRRRLTTRSQPVARGLRISSRAVAYTDVRALLSVHSYQKIAPAVCNQRNNLRERHTIGRIIFPRTRIADECDIGQTIASLLQLQSYPFKLLYGSFNDRTTVCQFFFFSQNVSN